MELFIFVGLPYLSLAILIVGTVLRYKHAPFTVSSLSSQILESKKLRFGSIAWHTGIAILLIGHLVAFLLPGILTSITNNPTGLIIVETVGLFSAVLAAFGLGALVHRRLVTPNLQAVTTRMDLVVLGLLLAQVLVGIAVALGQRWGSQWSVGTTTPYIWSLLTLRPNPAYVADLPTSMALHLSIAWVTFALVPFTRLIHAFSLPLQYFFRVPQRVIWTNGRRQAQHAAAMGGVSEDETRRHFVRGVGALVAAGALMGIGVLGKLGSYFKGQRLSRSEKAKLVSAKLARIKETGKERELELERLEKEAIFVAKVGQLDATDGRYFIDYKMRPALAFKGKDKLPILISAKCTHLGCTISNQLNEKNQILCPCHISYFDIKTGKPNAGAPAKLPLPKIGWLLKNGKGEIVVSQDSAGNRNSKLGDGPIDPVMLDGLEIWIAREFETEEV